MPETVPTLLKADVTGNLDVKVEKIGDLHQILPFNEDRWLFAE